MVLFGRQLIGDGAGPGAASLEAFREQMGIRELTSDAEGRFHAVGIGKNKLAAVADGGAAGRSPAVAVPAGELDASIVLRLAPPGSLRGVVRAGADPAAGVMVMIQPDDGARQVTMLSSSSDGSFVARRLAPGPYRITAMKGALGGGDTSSASTSIAVVSGAESTVALDLAAPGATLRVEVVDQAGAPVPSASVVLLTGVVRVSRAEELDDLTSRVVKAGLAAQGRVRLSGVAPGAYSLCAVGFPGSLMDPRVHEYMERHGDTMPARCRPLSVASATDEDVRIQVDVPALPPSG
jgi:hypothetical protein